jgi:hypothetical protein
MMDVEEDHAVNQSRFGKSWNGYKQSETVPLWSAPAVLKPAAPLFSRPPPLPPPQPHSQPQQQQQQQQHRQHQPRAPVGAAAVDQKQALIPKRDAAFQIEKYLDYTDHVLEESSETGEQEVTVTKSDEKQIGDEKKQKNDAKDVVVDKQVMVNDGNGGVVANKDLLQRIDPDRDNRMPNQELEPLELWFPTELPDDEIIKRRLNIKTRMQQSFVLDLPNLRQLVCEYDRLFFNNRLFEAFNFQKTAFRIKIGGTRMGKGVAGCCDYQGDVCTIYMHPGLANLSFGPKHPKREASGTNDDDDAGDTCEDVNGIECCDLLECVQLILEHELVHMLLMVFSRMLRESHGKAFKDLAHGLFGHLLFTHNIGGNGLSAAERVARYQDAEEKRKIYKPGTVLRFMNAPVAVIVRKNANVTIMHPNGRIVENVPYRLTELWQTDDADDEGASTKPYVPVRTRLKQLESNYTLFLNNKQAIQVGDVVQYANENGIILSARVLAKKALGAVIQPVAIGSTTATTLPFHTILPITLPDNDDDDDDDTLPDTQ